jgi:GxxExxY protein
MDFSTQRRSGAEGRREEFGPELTGKIIALAIDVHRHLGPGLLEGVYEKCPAWELEHNGFTFARQVDLPIIYRDVQIASGHKADIIVENQVIVELKAIEHLLPIHEAQTRTYLRLSGCKVGLLMNFNSVLLKDGIRRIIP